MKAEPAFLRELSYIRKHYQGRPTPVTFAKGLTVQTGGAQIYLKREDLNHTGAHKINHCIGSVVGLHPFPTLVRDFQSVIGAEARGQMLEMTGSLLNHVVACVGGSSNAMGIFSGFLEDASVKLYGVEPLGRGGEPGNHAASLSYGTPGILHGFKSMLLQDASGAGLALFFFLIPWG
ncbi:MAG: hypothetical protein SPI69_06965 [Elusimicrobiaceae bacterium]|nr:hypothetical protein [Elusimicrobiaceae bacterium]